MKAMLDFIDQQLGRITMYRLVLYGLIVLSAMAAMLMITKNLDYSALSFLISIAVSVGAAYGSNRLLGWLFGVKPHSESALITGLILALLFTPPGTLIGFVKIALIAVIAMASKYIIAIRGRHVFNPAAIAIVIGSVSGLAFAGWWIATPGMIPVTLLVVLLILYRTKKMRVAFVFLAVSIVVLLLRGTDPLTSVMSWPLLFIAGIMLTEPLTLPPRLHQQYFVAALVGILISTPFHYGRITMTPALALIIGNFIGWWLGERRAIKLRYVGKKQLGNDTYDLTFDTAPLSFEPGQYVELSLPHRHADSRGLRRLFSIAAKPGDDQISIGTKIPVKPSSYKRTLMNLKPGDTLYATRIAGDFVLPADNSQPIVCIAGGIGVTPFISFLQSTNRKMKLVYGVTSISDLSYVDLLRQHAVDVTVVSKTDGTLPDAEWNLITGKIDKDMLKKLIDVSQQPIVYVSGPPTMVLSTRRALKEIGIRRVKVDEFSGY